MTSSLQQTIAAQLHVEPFIEPARKVRAIIDFMKDYCRFAGAKGFVLGISGGQDSSLCGKLAQLAIDELNEPAGGYQFIAVRLPYGQQRDKADAELALEFIRPDRAVVLNIREAVDGCAAAYDAAMGVPLPDYHKGNVKARERMVAQYAIAGHHGLLVLGTDHAAEAVTGFYTKFGDGAVDLTPLTGLTKRQGRQLLQHLGAPPRLYEKAPTADLEDNRPLCTDEEVLGLRYEQIDDYLEGKPVDAAVAAKIEHIFMNTRHKRALPVTMFDTWWRSA